MTIYAKFVPFDNNDDEWVTLRGQIILDESDVIAAGDEYAESNPWEMAESYLDRDDLAFEVDEIYGNSVSFRVSGGASVPLDDILDNGEAIYEAAGWELDEYSLDFTSVSWSVSGGEIRRDATIKGRRLSG